jgi:hypothetical protein
MQSCPIFENADKAAAIPDGTRLLVLFHYLCKCRQGCGLAAATPNRTMLLILALRDETKVLVPALRIE